MKIIDRYGNNTKTEPNSFYMCF